MGCASSWKVTTISAQTKAGFSSRQLNLPAELHIDSQQGASARSIIMTVTGFLSWRGQPHAGDLELCRRICLSSTFQRVSQLGSAPECAIVAEGRQSSCSTNAP